MHIPGTNQLHKIYTPTDIRNVFRKEPDPFHIEGVTILDATIKDLEHAWACDYASSSRPMQVLLSAGVEVLKQGCSATDLIVDFMDFKQQLRSRMEKVRKS